MITTGIMKTLHDAIQIYDKLCGKNYLISFGSRNEYKFVQVIIKQSSFWHLLGCSLDPDTHEGKNNTYLKCKNQENVSDKISSIHSFSEIKEKYEAMKNVFNFIEKSSQIKICHTINCPEKYLFKIGTGNHLGIIGYDHPNKSISDFLFPKSAQLKSISKLSQNPSRILMILSKNMGDKYYNNIEYEIKHNIHLDIIPHLPSKIKIQL